MSNLTQRPAKQVIRELQGRRQKQQLLQIIKQPADTTERVYQFNIHNPSRRVSMAVEVFFEATDWPQEDLTYTATWLVDACTLGVNSGVAIMYVVEGPEPIPRMYEVDTAVKVIRIKPYLKAPLKVPGATPCAGYWWARVMWEPNTPLDDDELQDLFSKCNADVPVLVP